MSATRSCNLAAPVFRVAQTDPAAAALVVDGREYTYAELATAAARIAHRLRALAEDNAPLRVGILAARSFETYAGILGAAWAGGTYVPLNPKHPPARLAAILRRAGLAALIADRHGAAHLDDAELRAAAPANVLAGDALATVLGRDALALPPVDIPPDHAAYIMFTSGTTGVPKGVVITAGGVAHFLAHMRTLYGIGSADRVGQWCETSFDVSVFEMFAAWDGGASLHVVPESKLMAPAGFIRQQGLTVWTSVPSVIAMLARMKMLAPGMFPSLRISFFIGEALPVASAQAWQAAAPHSVVDNHYGPTEATVACTLQRLGDPALETPGRGTMAIGQPYPGLAAAVVDASGGFVPDGEVGELALSGPQLATGYLDDPEQTARRFPILHHPHRGLSRWYLSGDLAVRDARGILHCLGRVDNQVKIVGHRVELEDVEAHLRAASGTDAVATITWPIVSGSAAGIVAFVCGAALAPPEIRERLRQRVPPYMVPQRIVAVEALPRLPNGKVDRHALRALLEPSP